MRKFKIEVETVKTYIIEVDDTMLTDEDLKAWESVFYDLDSADDKISSLALDYCESRANLGDVFIEGHGRVLTEGRSLPYKVDESEVCPYMKIIKADDDGVVCSSVKEMV